MSEGMRRVCGLAATAQPDAEEHLVHRIGGGVQGSASMAVDPETSPATNFAIAMTTLARSAMTMVRVLSPSAARRRAVGERRWGGVCALVALTTP